MRAALGIGVFLALAATAIAQPLPASFRGRPLPPPTERRSTSVPVWIPMSGVDHFEVPRSSHNGPYVTIATPTVPSYSDSGLFANTTYLYLARAVNAEGGVSANSNKDAATTIMFSDDPLVVASTPVRAVHLNQLQTAVNAMQDSAGDTPSTFTPALSSTIIQALPILQLRAALDHARQVIGMPPLTYTDATLTVGVTVIQAAHFEELRNGVK